MPTHQEKDAIIKSLKDKVKELEGKLISQVTEGDMTEIAMGMEKEGSDYVLVELQYDPKTGHGKVVKRTKLDLRYKTAIFRAKEFLVEKIMMRYRRR
jgi:hypothetical protein